MVAFVNKWSIGFMALMLAGGAMGVQIGQDVAQSVAVKGVEAVFPGEGWVPADAVAVSDGEGGVAAWGFVFALEGSVYAEEGAVRAAVADGEVGDDGESELYVSTATIVTGANDTDSLYFRHFRGLADWYQEGTKDGWRGEAVRLGAGDIRYAAPAPAGARGGGKLAALKKAAGYVRRELGRKVDLRYVPEILFELDTNIEYAAHINQLLKETQKHGEESDD